MVRPRSELIPESSGGVFHLVTRCVRRERLLDRGERKIWLCRGLAGWLRHMGIDLLAYSIMGNHLHLVVRLRPDVHSWDPIPPPLIFVISELITNTFSVCRVRLDL